MNFIAASDYLSEAQVLAHWPMITGRELRRARRSRAIAHYIFNSGPCYTPAQVQEYIDRVHLRACVEWQNAPPATANDSASGTITSTGPTPTAADTGTPAGMTPQLAEHAAAALASQISSKPRSRSPRSSPPPPKRPREQRRKAHLALIAS